VWTERLTATGAEVVSRYADGPVAGLPALTRRTAGDGTAWYLATRVDADGTAALVRRLCREAGVTVEDRPGVEVVRRVGATSSYLFVLNHTDREVTVAADGVDLLSGRSCSGTVTVAAGGVAVVRSREVS
jgi:beta-galactosidase